MSNQPNILFLTLHSFGLTGGIEQICKTFTKALFDLKTEQKIKSYFVLSMYDDQPDSNYMDPSLFKGYRGKQVTFGLAAIKKGLRADILVLSHIHLLTFARIIKRLKPNTRIVLLAHGIEIWNALADWKKQLLHKIEIWAVSRYTAKRLAEINHINPNKIKILNNSLDPYFIFPEGKNKPSALLERYNINVDQKVILTLCRLASTEQYKGYDLVIQSLKDLVKIYPDLVYLLAGKADDTEQKRINKLIKQCKLEKNVICTGFISDAELPSYYQLADVFIMPSKAEGFGLVFIEAGAYGCSVIGGFKDGSTDALLDGKIGKLIDPEDADAIYQSMLLAFQNPLNQEKIKEQQMLTQHHFSYHQYKNKVNELFADTIFEKK